ncbi:MAG: hypothetical protein PHH71_00965 [Clostridia bacterium]|jgi:hypothetical protein|nr:hypothetical protein [Clostridia bacterium]MDD3231732.1 hypothetical protein [Clostridia bacterium]MDD3862325.1 hypothetical protein [Clostridia bacterium]MDD4408240.1 hypothetical protein [Clostridia bacterium]
MRTKNIALKRLALKAKKRLTGKNKINTYNIDTKKPYGNVRIISCEEDERFYKKVCKILSENRDIQNPLGKLIDRNIYNSLTVTSKEKYFFDLIDKYAECKARFEKENSVSAYNEVM